MSNIDIRHAHSLQVKQAKQSVERLAGKIAERFGVEYAWRGNTLEFERMGVHGAIKVMADEIHVVAKLGFLLMGLRGPVEDEIRRQMVKEFGEG